MNIRVDLNYPIKDGTEVVFRSPVDCSQVTGLKVYYPGASKEFVLADAHGNNVGDIDHLFAEDVVVKVILDVTKGMAFVQNADTNAYIERTFIKTVNGTKPDENGNVNVEGGPGGEVPSSHINDKNNPHKVYAEQIGAAPANQVGDMYDVYSVSHLVEINDRSRYVGTDGSFKDNENCIVYSIPFVADGNHKEELELRGKRLRIKTYAYDDMSYSLGGDPSGATNTKANIDEDRRSGIWEFEVDIPEDYHGVFHISFCSNDYLDAPEIAISQGTVWEEIKSLQYFRDNLADYLPIYNGEVLE